MEKKEYDGKIIGGLWKTHKGHLRSLPADGKTAAAIAAHFEEGGEFLIRNRTAESINGAKDPTKAPVAYLEFIPAKVVTERKKEFEAKKAAKNESL